jgi:hypothetical protein
VHIPEGADGADGTSTHLHLNLDTIFSREQLAELLILVPLETRQLDRGPSGIHLLAAHLQYDFILGPGVNI